MLSSLPQPAWESIFRQIAPKHIRALLLTDKITNKLVNKYKYLIWPCTLCKERIRCYCTRVNMTYYCSPICGELILKNSKFKNMCRHLIEKQSCDSCSKIIGNYRNAWTCGRFHFYHRECTPCELCKKRLATEFIDWPRKLAKCGHCKYRPYTGIFGP